MCVCVCVGGCLGPASHAVYVHICIIIHVHGLSTSSVLSMGTDSRKLWYISLWKMGGGGGGEKGREREGECRRVSIKRISEAYMYDQHTFLEAAPHMILRKVVRS